MRARWPTKDHQARARLDLPGGHRRGSAPLGSPTRGKTAPGRLRGLDTLALLYAPQLFRPRRGPRADAPFVDLGYGETPQTTLESAVRFRRRAPQLPVIGYEIDRHRVAAAEPFEDARTRFRLGGFDFELEPFGKGRAPQPARLVRAFNVLRQYDEPSASPALALMLERIEAGGLLIEGSSDPAGRLWSAQLLRSRAGSMGAEEFVGGVGSGNRYRSGNRFEDGRGDADGGPAVEALAFGVSDEPGFTPAALRAVLPKRFVHRVVPGSGLHAFFERWEREWRSAAGRSGRARLGASVRALRRGGRQGRGFHVDPRSRWLRRGIVLWRCSLDGVPDEGV